MKLFVAIALTCALCTTAFTLSSAPALEQAGFKSVGSADLSTALKLTIRVPTTNQAALTKFVEDVSNPKNARYGQHMTTQEVMEFTRPAAASVTAVESWLTANNVEFTTSSMGHTIKLATTVEVASKLFSTTFSAVHNEVTKQSTVIGQAVNIPESLAEHVEAVFGVHGLPLPPRQNLRSGAAPADVTPEVIKSTYGVSNVTVSGSTKNRIGVLEFQGQLMSQKDLTTFFEKYVPGFKSGEDQVYKYVGDQSQGEGVEANLDVQYAMGVAPGIKTEMWQYANTDFCGDIATWTSAALSDSNPPNVFTVSYGFQGALSQLGCSNSQIDSIDSSFKSMCAAGLTILFASGDSGSGYTAPWFQTPSLYSSWPAASVYVTAVGATRFQGQQVGNPEQAVDQFGSGGGFSKIFTEPSFQTSAVSQFLSEETDMPTCSYGKGGRGTPDVAALGEGFQVIMNGSPESVGGTSASTPAFAGIVALLNEARSNAGKGSLGLLNQWIYQNPSMFTDITVGNNRISRSGQSVPDGWDCEQGWDPVTGFGTPIFKKLLISALSQA